MRITRMPWLLSLLAVLGLMIGAPAAAKSGAEGKAGKPAKVVKPKAKPATLTLQLEGLDKKTKPRQVKQLQAKIRKVKGVMTVRVAKDKGQVIVRHRPDTDLAAVRQAVSEAGFKVAGGEPANPPADKGEPDDEEAMPDE